MTTETIATVATATTTAAAKVAKVRKPKLSKIDANGELSLEACAILALKAAKEGDLLLWIGADKSLRLVEALIRLAQRGAHGGTLITFRDVMTDELIELTTTNVLPEGVLDIHKVSKGVNSRTMSKLGALAAGVADALAESDAAPAVEAPAPVSEPVADLAPVSEDVAVELSSDDTEVLVVDDAPAADESADMLVAAMVSDADLSA